MIKDSLKVTGEVNIKLFNSKGELKQEISKSNLVVAGGKSFIASRMISNISSPMNHMAIGHGTVAPNTSDTALNDEASNARISIASPTTTGAGNVLTFTGIFGPTYGVGSITEAGIFNSNSGGTMLCRTVFPAVTKVEDDVIAISWTITIN